VGLLIHRDLRPRDLAPLFLHAGVTSAAVLFLVATASLFSWVLTTQGLAQALGAAVLAISPTPALFLLLVNLVVLAAGCFMDAISIFYLLVPILAPAARNLGVDPVHLGVIFTVNLALGQVTPPVGVNLVVAAGISETPVPTISRAALPLLLAEAAVLLLVTYVPALSLWLPQWMG